MLCTEAFCSYSHFLIKLSHFAKKPFVFCDQLWSHLVIKQMLDFVITVTFLKKIIALCRKKLDTICNKIVAAVSAAFCNKV